MKRRVRHEAKHEEQGKSLTLSQCRQKVFTSLFFLLLIGVVVSIVLATHQHRSRYDLLTVCLWGAIWAMS